MVANQLNTGDDKDLVEFDAGEDIFLEGDPGGDLFVILQGEVEIYRNKNNQNITLSKMSAGEVIGLFTCLDQTNRKASARATTKIKARKIPHRKIQKAIGTLPKWFTVILKEYTLRLSEIENVYMAQTVEFEEKKHNFMSPLTDARFFSTSLICLSKFLKITVEDQDYVPMEAVHEAISECLGVDKYKIEVLAHQLLDAGLLIQVTEPDKNRNCYPIHAVEMLADFPLFLARTKAGPIKKMVTSLLPNKSIRIARAIVKFASLKKMKTTTDITIPLSTLEADLQTTLGVEFDRDALDPLEEIKLLKIKEDSEGFEHAELTPKKTGRYIAQIVAYQKLQKLNYKKLKSEIEDENAA